jgi:exodeoxyribonuclease VII small subunit
MSKKFDYDAAMEEINQILLDLQDSEVPMAVLEEKVIRASRLIESCQKELTQLESTLESALNKNGKDGD